MNIQIAEGWKNIRYFIVHHSGGSSSNPYQSDASLTLEQIDRAHENRWPDFKSSMGYFVGYNFVILHDGKCVQTRAVGEETAHTIGYNRIAVGICLVGNHTKRPDGSIVDEANQAQIDSLREIWKALQANGIEIKDWNIGPHRLYQQKLTECYGNAYPDDWARKVILEPKTPVEELQQRAILLQALVDLWTRLIDLQRQLKLKYGSWRIGASAAPSCLESNNRG